MEMKITANMKIKITTKINVNIKIDYQLPHTDMKKRRKRSKATRKRLLRSSEGHYEDDDHYKDQCERKKARSIELEKEILKELRNEVTKENETMTMDRRH